MTATRSRKANKTYDAYRAEITEENCQFCEITETEQQFIAATDNFMVVHNLFPYTFWDSQHVVDHLLLIPKQHTDTLKDLSPAVAAEFMHILSKYEARGYNVYARTPSSKMKSVVHQHTHLIKTKGHMRWFVFMMRRPYLRIIF